MSDEEPVIARRTQKESEAYIAGFEAGAKGALRVMTEKIIDCNATAIADAIEHMEKAFKLMKEVNEDLKANGAFKDGQAS